MNKTERMRYARAILLAQDKIALVYFRKIRAELKRVGKELGESYALNQTSLQFPDLQQKHKERVIKILNDLVFATVKVFMNDKVGQKRMFTLDVANEVYALLAANVLTTSALISQNTVASATVVILQQMQLSLTKPKASEPEVIAKAIAKKIGGVNSISRAMTIARTETHKAANTTQYTKAEWAAQESGLKVEVEWIATNDGRVRDNHRHADGQKRPIGQPFNVGGEAMRYPSDPRASGSNTINCRCVLGYDTIDE
ncbi:MAG TPA: phage minor head protein [Candidatus Saccharibacteria bacterium]|nr:phage minor head protein [Candidatus Saccharibacteria bacterium]